MNLASAMKKHRVSVEELSKITGVKVAMVKAVLAGRKSFHHKRAQSILDLFKGDVTLYDLYGIRPVKKR